MMVVIDIGDIIGLGIMILFFLISGLLVLVANIRDCIKYNKLAKHSIDADDIDNDAREKIRK